MPAQPGENRNQSSPSLGLPSGHGPRGGGDNGSLQGGAEAMNERGIGRAFGRMGARDGTVSGPSGANREGAFTEDESAREYTGSEHDSGGSDPGGTSNLGNGNAGRGNRVPSGRPRNEGAL